MFSKQLSCIPSENHEDGLFIPFIFKKSGFDAEKTVKHEILSTSSENPSVIQYLKIIYRGICSIGRMKERINGLFKIIE